MGKIGFRIRSKVNKQVSIYVYLYGPFKTRLEAKTGFVVLRDEWDIQKMRARISDENGVRLNGYLDQLERHLVFQYNNLHSSSQEFTRGWLESQISACFNRPDKDNRSKLTYQIRRYINVADTKRVRSTGSIGLSYNTIRSYELFEKIIKNFEEYRGQPVLIEHIDKALIDSFTHWMLKIQKYSTNNTGHQLKQIKTICKEADRNGLQVHPFTKHIEGFRQRRSERIIHTISFEEIERIKNLKDLSPELENTRKWMLIGFYSGQRVSDLLKLTEAQVRQAMNGVYIDVTQQKTGKHVTIGVSDPMTIKIIKEEFPKPLSAILFNKYIKEVCKKAGMTEHVKGFKQNPETRRKEPGIFPKYELICAHDLRRSFATNYFGKVETPILMSITGHSKETTFLSYIGANPNKDALADAFMMRAANL